MNHRSQQLALGSHTLMLEVADEDGVTDADIWRCTMCGGRVLGVDVMIDDVADGEAGWIGRIGRQCPAVMYALAYGEGDPNDSINRSISRELAERERDRRESRSADQSVGERTGSRSGCSAHSEHADQGAARRVAAGEGVAERDEAADSHAAPAVVWVLTGWVIGVATAWWWMR